MKNKKAFTLIELLITVAIIGILAGVIFTTLNFARTKAKDASFKSSAKSARSAINVCCVGDGIIQEKTTGAGDGVSVCDDPDIIDAIYPGDNNIGTVVVDSQCDSGFFQVTVTPGAQNAGSCESITYDETGEVSNVGCDS
jgi:prepilin-type N-terminal cleavage/methylation domain-containing protein